MFKGPKLTALGLLLAVTASVVNIQSAEAREGRRGRMKEIAAELNLTAEQKEKMKEINKDRKEVLSPKRKAMKEARESLETSLKGADSADVVKQKFAALQKAQSEFASARFEKVLAAREVLTPEQRSKFKGMKMGGHHHDEESDD